MNVCVTYRELPAVPDATDTPVEDELANTRTEFDSVTEIDRVLETELKLPFESVKESAAMRTDPVPETALAAVNVTVRLVPEVERFDSVPRVTVKSPSARSLTLSLNAMVMVHVSPDAMLEEHPDNVAVGFAVS